MKFDDLQASSINWREQIRRNEQRTRFVIIAFIALYVFVGVLVDLLMLTELTNVSTGHAIHILFNLQHFPYATVSMGVIAIISLMVTIKMYDKIMLLGTNSWEVTHQSANSIQEKQLINVVEEMKIAAGLNYLPKIYMIEADYMNAFATGYSEKSALVAITRGLLVKLDRAELTAVMAHELSHVRHLDIKLTLVVGVLSNIMLMVSDFFFYRPMYRHRTTSSGKNNGLIVAVMILRYLLPLLTLLLTLFLSRSREYMADAGCVELMRDNEPLARALLKIHDDHQANAEKYQEAYGETAHEDVRRAAYLYDPVKAGIEPVLDISSMFSTHPKLEDRLKALGFKSGKAKTKKAS